MHVKLRVIGDRSKVEYNPRARTIAQGASQFVIGSGEDCCLRCASKHVRERHCLMVVAGDSATVRDLTDGDEVFVNGVPVENTRLLQTGDHLRVGDVEFAVEFQSPPQAASPTPGTTASSSEHGMATENSPDGEISNWLAAEDELERQRRAADPQMRRFHVEGVAKDEKDEAALEQEEDPPKEKPSKKKPPGKLPQSTFDHSTQAADAALSQRYGNTVSRVFKKDK